MGQERARGAKSAALSASAWEIAIFSCKDLFMLFEASRNDILHRIDGIRGINLCKLQQLI
jgi:hypothetical protein